MYNFIGNYVIPAALVFFLVPASWALNAKQPKIPVVRLTVLIIFGIHIATLAIYTTDLYISLAKLPTAQSFLPPGGTFWLRQIWTQLTPVLSGWTMAGLVFLVLTWLMKKLDGRIDATDVILLTLGVAIVGWPAGLLFLLGVFLLATLALVVQQVLRRGEDNRMAITPYVILVALLIQFFKGPLLDWTGLAVIRF